MSKKRVLISALGSPIFPYVIKSLGDKYDLTLTDADPMVKVLYPKDRVYVTPLAKDKDFLETIEKIIAENKIEYYIPMVDEEISQIVSLGKRLKGLKVIAPNNLKFVDLCLNKYRLMKKLAEEKISHINTCLGTEFQRQFPYPVFVKPSVGRGSRGVCKINNRKQFKAYLELGGYGIDQVMVQEYLDGEEYSTSVVVNNLNQLIAVVPKKIIVKVGTTKHAVVKQNYVITEVCRRIVSKLKPGGGFNVQLKIVDSQVKIFEINPRCSGTSPLTCEAGVNEYALCIENYGRRRVSFIDSFIEGVHLLRNWETYFYR